jgi:phage shock protein PspC (stress-responsive transcriptional regulator)
MNKVISINLNQNAYQVEEAGYEALKAYLDKAAAKLGGNPDKDEIMADFEQAIADKCDKYLKKGKTVVTTAEITDVLAQMGPVEDVANEETDAKASPSAGPKRLFKIREGAMFEGVCNGIAAYFDIDATLVRVGFIILTVITGGAWIIAYILMALFMPEARTAEDIATAQGKPFNAKTLLAGAHERYEYWKKFGQEQTEEWKKHHHQPDARTAEATNKAQSYRWKYEDTIRKHMPTIEEIERRRLRGSKFTRGAAGLLGGVGVLALSILGLAWLWQAVVLLTGGTVFGYFVGVSSVAVTVLVSAMFYIVFLPAQALVGEALQYAKGEVRVSSFWWRLFTFALWLGMVGTVWYLAHNDARIATDLIKMYQDVTHYFGV